MDANHISQQTVLTQLGYYDGKVEGIWGPKTIAAKVKFERSGQFAPAIPNHGLPFVQGHMLPFNLQWVDGELTVKGYGVQASETSDVVTAIEVPASPVPQPGVQAKQQTPSGFKRLQPQLVKPLAVQSKPLQPQQLGQKVTTETSDLNTDPEVAKLLESEMKKEDIATVTVAGEAPKEAVEEPPKESTGSTDASNNDAPETK